MSDKGKTAAISQLCREVGFGCPVCRSPFLTWHHFDPPWHVEKHWRPEGIIALCPLCHADADPKGENAGAYSNDELRAMKSSSRCLDDVKGHFPTWQDKSQLLVRVGGCYTDSLKPIISVNEIPQIALSKSEAGILALTFQLRDKDDNVLVNVEDNWFTAYPAHVHDMKVTPKTKVVKVWIDKDDVGLEFSFRRVTMSDLEELLRQDLERQQAIVTHELQRQFDALPQREQGFMRQAFDDAWKIQEGDPPSWVHDLPAVLRDAYIAEDKIGFFVKQWVNNNCLADDGLIPLLDFEQMMIHFHGERIVIRDGINESLYYSAAFNNAKGAINFTCQCPKCRSAPAAPA